MRAGITEAHGTALLFIPIFLLFLVEICWLSQLPTSQNGAEPPQKEEQTKPVSSAHSNPSPL